MAPTGPGQTVRVPRPWTAMVLVVTALLAGAPTAFPAHAEGVSNPACARGAGVSANGGIIPTAMAPAANGGVWFIESHGPLNRAWTVACVGLVAGNGTLREFALRTPPGSDLWEIAPDGTGGAWVLPLHPAGRIARITAAGTVTWHTFDAGSADDSMAISEDGASGLWVALNDASLVHLTAGGAVSTHPTGAVTVLDLTAAPDGGAWATGIERSGTVTRAVLARLTADGSMTVTRLHDAEGPVGESRISVATDGSVWFFDRATDGSLAAVRWREGTLISFPLRLPYPDSTINGMTAGPDGAIWFTVSSMEYADAGVGRITPEGTVAVYRRGLRKGSDPDGITRSTTGQIWFTEFSAARLGRVAPDGTITEIPPSAEVLRLAHTRTSVGVRLRCAPAQPWGCAGVIRLRLVLPNRMPEAGAGQERFRIRRGARATITVPLNAAARRMLRRTGVLRLAVLIRADSAATGHLGDEVERKVAIRRS